MVRLRAMGILVTCMDGVISGELVGLGLGIGCINRVVGYTGDGDKRANQRLLRTSSCQEEERAFLVIYHWYVLVTMWSQYLRLMRIEVRFDQESGVQSEGSISDFD